MEKVLAMMEKKKPKQTSCTCASFSHNHLTKQPLCIAGVPLGQPVPMKMRRLTWPMNTFQVRHLLNPEMVCLTTTSVGATGWFCGAANVLCRIENAVEELPKCLVEAVCDVHPENLGKTAVVPT